HEYSLVDYCLSLRLYLTPRLPHYIILFFRFLSLFLLFFFNDPATTEIYTLSLHDALRSPYSRRRRPDRVRAARSFGASRDRIGADRKSTRLNSSHRTISYAVFCLKKKNITHLHQPQHKGPHQCTICARHTLPTTMTTPTR